MSGVVRGLTTAVVLVVATLVGAVVLMEVADEATVEYINESAEWCGERGGEFYNANVIGPHGGLHCELPNGTSVHMSEVMGVSA